MTIVRIDLAGRTEYRNADGNLHNPEGPAVINDDGAQIWFHNGLKHREDGPAFVNHKEQFYEYWVHGYLHRIDGPARIHKTGYEYWYYGYFGRKDFPACQNDLGAYTWTDLADATIVPTTLQNYMFEFLHHTDRPVKTRPDGYVRYVIDNEQLTEQEFLRKKRARNLS